MGLNRKRGYSAVYNMDEKAQKNPIKDQKTARDSHSWLQWIVFIGFKQLFHFSSLSSLCCTLLLTERPATAQAWIAHRPAVPHTFDTKQLQYVNDILQSCRFCVGTVHSHPGPFRCCQLVVSSHSRLNFPKRAT